MLRKYLVFSIFISFFPTAFVFAWSATGHGLVGDIAYKYLSPLAKSRVNYYLQGRSVHQACTWMDSVKSTREYKYLTPRHYVDIDKGATYDTTSTNDVVYELNRVIGQLYQMNNLNDSMITQYVLEVFHLVGDIHQPLHCGYATDGGGNSIQVSFLGQNTNLHSVWDYSLISSGNVNLFSCLAANQFTQSQIQSIQQINVLEWMNESVQLVDTCYYPEKSNILDTNYINTRLPIVKQQLLKAGLRLAYVLETLFGANSPLPINLLSFDIQSSKNANTLFWAASKNKNISQFIIEKSTNATNFKTVGVVESDLSNESGGYHFVDLQSLGQVYYRLKLILKNGSTEYSSVVKSETENIEKQLISISPNPAKSFLNVQFSESKSKTVGIQLMGIDGKAYKTKEFQLNAGKASVNFDLSGINKGVYVLLVEGIGIQKVVVE